MLKRRSHPLRHPLNSGAMQPNNALQSKYKRVLVIAEIFLSELFVSLHSLIVKGGRKRTDRINLSVKIPDL